MSRILAILLLFCFGIIIPVLPHLVTTYAGGDAARGALVYGVVCRRFNLRQLLTTAIAGNATRRIVCGSGSPTSAPCSKPSSAGCRSPLNDNDGVGWM